ncbi:MAG: cupin domain-containing protein [Spirochaetales bacterium]|nr:cupin domain-containing protein [Spirochaetales bacterium]
MICRKGEHRIETRENARGGNGKVLINHLLESEQVFNKSRMFSSVTLEPGASLGYHIHENEVEFFYILKGAAKINDNGSEYILYPGDTLFTGDGEGHYMEACEGEPLEYIAIIILK